MPEQPKPDTAKDRAAEKQKKLVERKKGIILKALKSTDAPVVILHTRDVNLILGKAKSNELSHWTTAAEHTPSQKVKARSVVPKEQLNQMHGMSEYNREELLEALS